MVSSCDFESKFCLNSIIRAKLNGLEVLKSGRNSRPSLISTSITKYFKEFINFSLKVTASSVILTFIIMSSQTLDDQLPPNKNFLLEILLLGVGDKLNSRAKYSWEQSSYLKQGCPLLSFSTTSKWPERHRIFLPGEYLFSQHAFNRLEEIPFS